MTNFEKYFDCDWFEVIDMVWIALNGECEDCLFHKNCIELKIPCPCNCEKHERFKSWLGEEYIKMLPCPFCGNTNLVFIDSDGDDVNDEDNDGPFYGGVALCCSKHEGGCGASSGYENTKEEAVAKWNKRV